MVKLLAEVVEIFENECFMIPKHTNTNMIDQLGFDS